MKMNLSGVGRGGFLKKFKKFFQKNSEKIKEKTKENEKIKKKNRQKKLWNGWNDMLLIQYQYADESNSGNVKKYEKNLKNFWKKYWQTETYMIYYMSARRKGAKNNGPWKLNNNK